MEVTARLTKEWKKRMLLLVAFCLAGSGWFFYDGFIGYPKIAERYAEFDKLAQGLIEKGEAQSPDDESVRLAWADRARELGWKVEKPKNKTESDYLEQKYYGSALAMVALGLLVWFIVSSSQTILFDGKTITTANGRQVDIDSVVELDKKKWDKKGIAYAVYEENGERRKMTLDDYKFGGAVAIVEEIERRLADKNTPTATP